MLIINDILHSIALLVYFNLPHIFRGGGELGRKWYHMGRRKNKNKTFEVFGNCRRVYTTTFHAMYCLEGSALSKGKTNQ